MNIKLNVALCFIIFMSVLSLSLSAQLTEVSYLDEGQKLKGYFNPSSKHKEKVCILILPAWKGIDEHAQKVSRQLSVLGYANFIADIYGEGHYPQNVNEAARQSGFYKKNITQYHHRIALALEQLKRLGGKEVVVIGYCFGGTGALEAARAGMDVQGVVSFHGGLSRDTLRTIQPILSKILVLHGADDPFISPDDIRLFQQEMKTAKADWQMLYFGGAVHSFTDLSAGKDNSRGAAYNALADERSWMAFLSFLKEFKN